MYKFKYDLPHSLVHSPTIQPYGSTSKLAPHKEHSQNGQHLQLTLPLLEPALPLEDILLVYIH